MYSPILGMTGARVAFTRNEIRSVNMATIWSHTQGSRCPLVRSLHSLKDKEIRFLHHVTLKPENKTKMCVVAIWARYHAEILSSISGGWWSKMLVGHSNRQGFPPPHKKIEFNRFDFLYSDAFWEGPLPIYLLFIQINSLHSDLHGLDKLTLHIQT
jgi:hypothetical protein